MPLVKLVEKKLVAGKVIDHYDSPKTPYQRILESPDVAASLKRDLKEQLETLNPFRLRKTMENKLKTIFNICYRKKPFVTVPLTKLLPGNI